MLAKACPRYEIMSVIRLQNRVHQRVIKPLSRQHSSSKRRQTAIFCPAWSRFCRKTCHRAVLPRAGNAGDLICWKPCYASTAWHWYKPDDGATDACTVVPCVPFAGYPDSAWLTAPPSANFTRWSSSINWPANCSQSLAGRSRAS